MIPGPVEISEDILEAYNGQPVAHYGSEWTDIYLRTEHRVSRLLGCTGRTFLMPGSGSLGLEAVAVTLCAGRSCLVLSNGMFGERLFSVVSAHAGKTEVLRFPPAGPVDAAGLRKKLAGNTYDVVLAVHVETSTGVLNPIRELAGVVKEKGSMFLVDAVSSAAVELLALDDWGIDAVVTASQKGFETPPGLAIVTVAGRIVPEIERKSPGSWYTDLHTWCAYYRDWHDWHPFPVTLPTNNILAVSRSLDIIESTGMENRHAFFCNAAERIRNAFTALGLRPLIDGSRCAHGITAVSTAGLFDPALLISFLKEELGIQIAGSFGEMKSHVFRVGHMSRKQCDARNILALVGGVSLFMQQRGLKVDPAGALLAISRTDLKV
jgi:aspartate aminotransferase-like enzyme